MIIGYTAGVFDLFHVGHVRMLKNAKSLCDKLIVAVSTDKLARYKNKLPVIPFEERQEVVDACQYVDVTVPQESLDKVDAWHRYKYHILFVGDDWYQTASWEQYEQQLNQLGAKIIYHPYTKGTSSTLVNEVLINLRNKE